MGGAGRGWGTILRGSGRAGRWRRGNGRGGRRRLRGGRRGVGGRGGRWRGSMARAAPLLPLPVFLARMAFSTSPGLEICERSILGVMVCGARDARGAAVAGSARSALKMRANLVGLVLLQRTGVGLAAAQAEFRQYVKNLPALDFHLAREIVDTNLTHPPLFKICYPKPLSRS